MLLRDQASRRTVLTLTVIGALLVSRHGMGNLPETGQAAIDRLRAGGPGNPAPHH
jgi:hypothetical protein